MFNVTPKTFYQFDCYRNGLLVWSDGFPNMVMSVGKSALLDSTFFEGRAEFTWFVGLVDSAGFSAFSAADTMSSHAGWVENDDYSALSRAAYVPTAAAAGVMTNSTAKASFSMNAVVTIQGAFLVDDGAKMDTVGILYGAGSFNAPRNVLSGDVLSVTVRLTVS